MKKLTNSPSRGFSIIELMIATLLFTIIAGVVFSLLTTTQLHYGSERDLMAAFQSANIAMDQIARDVHTAGYPPANFFKTTAVALHPDVVALPFSWSKAAGYPNSPCNVGATCNNIPGDFDLIVEADFGDGKGVQWIRYSLQGTTLLRGVAKKVAGDDPVADTNDTTNVLMPYLDNVMNNAPAAQMDQIRASYPAMFPADAPVPVFTYTQDQATTLQPLNVRQVNICLIVQSPRPDPVTGQPRVLTLTGQAMRFNPSQ